MKNKKKEKMELAQKTPETANPFGMMRRSRQGMERLFPTLFNESLPVYH